MIQSVVLVVNNLLIPMSYSGSFEWPNKVLLHSPLPLNPLPPPQRVRVNAGALGLTMTQKSTGAISISSSQCCYVVLQHSLRQWDVLCIVSVVCDVVKRFIFHSHDPHTVPNSSPWYLWKHNLCGGWCVSFFIVKVCLFLHNSFGYSPFAVEALLCHSNMSVGWAGVCVVAAVSVDVWLFVDDLNVKAVLFLVLIFVFFRYDEWIKADKIVRPANKNVPKIKHRKKIKV